jgi:hypothetical protein
MGLPFALVIGTGCVAGVMRHRTQDEMHYLCNIIAIVCFVLILVLAPGWLRGIIVLGIIGEQFFSRVRADGFQDGDGGCTDQPKESFDIDAASPIIPLLAAREEHLQYRGVTFDLDIASPIPPPLTDPEEQLHYRGVTYRLARPCEE